MQVVRGSLEIEGTAFHRTQFDGFCAELHKMREYLVCRMRANASVLMG